MHAAGSTLVSRIVLALPRIPQLLLAHSICPVHGLYCFAPADCAAGEGWVWHWCFQGGQPRHLQSHSFRHPGLHKHPTVSQPHCVLPIQDQVRAHQDLDLPQALGLWHHSFADLVRGVRATGHQGHHSEGALQSDVTLLLQMNA